jgi:hypothetical protein
MIGLEPEAIRSSLVGAAGLERRDASVDASRARILLSSALAAVLLCSVLAPPVAAAECSLAAPATGRVGSMFAVMGSGFPGGATIDVSLTVEGGNPDQFSIQSDASGAFEITLTPEAVDEGETTVVARAGSTCTARITFEILGVNEPAPTPIAEPTAEPTGEAAGATASSSPDAPRTDVVLASGVGVEHEVDAWLSGGLLLIMLGAFGLLASGRAGGRRDP